MENQNQTSKKVSIDLDESSGTERSLTPLAQKFMLHFGEMGSRWGINRTVGQVYACLFISADPLNAEDLVALVGVSRSNVSMSLKELQSWNLVRMVHRPKDRRDYFTTPDDIWEIVRTLAEERKKREIDPTLTFLREVLMDEPISAKDRYAQGRMAEMHELIQELTGWYDDVSKLETAQLVGLLRLGAKVKSVLSVKEKLSFFPGNRKKSPNLKKS